MATVTGLTAAAMQAIRDGVIVDAEVIGGDLILTKYDTTTINAGPVVGPAGADGSDGATGATGPTGPVNLVDQSEVITNSGPYTGTTVAPDLLQPTVVAGNTYGIKWGPIPALFASFETATHWDIFLTADAVKIGMFAWMEPRVTGNVYIPNVGGEILWTPGSSGTPDLQIRVEKVAGTGSSITLVSSSVVRRKFAIVDYGA